MAATLTIVLDAPTGLPYWACLQVDDKGPIWMQKASQGELLKPRFDINPCIDNDYKLHDWWVL